MTSPFFPVRGGDARRSVIVHVHIFKNAGTTLDWALRRNFGAGFIDHRDDAIVTGQLDFLKGFLRDHPEISAFSSHKIAFPFEDDALLRFFPLYLVRDPVVRARSVYLFERQQAAGGITVDMARRLSFPDFVAWGLSRQAPPVIRNAQAIFFGRQGRFFLTPEAGESALELAARHPLVGVVERFDDSMVLFENVLRPEFPGLDLAYVRQNIGQSRQEATRAAILAELGDLGASLEEANALDTALYRRVGESLDARIVTVPDFAGRLAAFQRRCACLAG